MDMQVTRQMVQCSPASNRPVGGAVLPLTWIDYETFIQRCIDPFHGRFRLRHFEYRHPVRLQQGSPARLRKEQAVRVAYTDWGPRHAPVLVCCGGVANTAMRFNFLASDLCARFRVIVMDWVGRGQSGWMPHESDYALSTYVEQLRQLVAHLGVRHVFLLGSSMGGSVVIEFAARHPQKVQGIVLNDIGPYIPRARRKRRAETLARHYVFREPSELFRRIGASQKNDGCMDDRVRFSLGYYQTRWSDADGGRVYRHDVRAMQAYQKEAAQCLDQWASWEKVSCPVLLIHGLLSDALLPATIRRMVRNPRVSVMHVPDTGHTPVLCDPNHTGFILQWLSAPQEPATAWSVLHAPPL